MREERWSKLDFEEAERLINDRPLAKKPAKRLSESRDHYDREALFDKGETIKRGVVGEQVAMLIGSFPNATPRSAKVYTTLLIEEIIAVNPMPSMLESACRHIRRTMNFLPTIAEVPKALREQGELWADRWHCDDECIEYWHSTLKTQITKRRERHVLAADD